MQSPISVIIPVHNHAQTIERSLRSLAQQTVKVKEIIIVNDGSTDNFKKTMSKIKVDLLIKIIEQDNKGAPTARNRGLAEATGDYVIFWDADTIAKPAMLEKMSLVLENNPGTSYVYSQYKFGWKTMKSHEFDAEMLKNNNYIDSGSLIRRLDMPSAGWDESLKRLQDWDLWLTMLYAGKTGKFIPEILYKKIVGGTKNISAWLPSFMYKLPWKLKRVKEYEGARKIIQQKHHPAP